MPLSTWNSREVEFEIIFIWPQCSVCIVVVLRPGLFNATCKVPLDSLCTFPVIQVYQIKSQVLKCKQRGGTLRIHLQTGSTWSSSSKNDRCTSTAIIHPWITFINLNWWLQSKLENNMPPQLCPSQCFIPVSSQTIEEEEEVRVGNIWKRWLITLKDYSCVFKVSRS